MNQKRRSGLGRGLESLIPAGESGDEPALLELPLDSIQPNPRQPRRTFGDEDLEGLAASIREAGVLQPIVVQETESGYSLIAGERRLRASRLAGLASIPAVVRVTDGEMSLLSQALIENIQREDLRPLEEAGAFQELVETFGLTHEQVGERVGKSRATVSNSLRLLTLPPSVQALVDRGELTAGHARALVGLEDEAFVEHVATRAAKEGWSVRQVEDAARLRKSKDGPVTQTRVIELRPPAIVQLEERLAEKLGTRVKISHRGTKGRVVITYSDLDDLEKISRLVYDV